MNQGPPESVVVQNRYALSGSPRAAKSFRKRMGVQKEVVQVGCAEVVRRLCGHFWDMGPKQHLSAIRKPIPNLTLVD